MPAWTRLLQARRFLLSWHISIPSVQTNHDADAQRRIACKIEVLAFNRVQIDCRRAQYPVRKGPRASTQRPLLSGLDLAHMKHRRICQAVLGRCGFSVCPRRGLSLPQWLHIFVNEVGVSNRPNRPSVSFLKRMSCLCADHRSSNAPALDRLGYEGTWPIKPPPDCLVPFKSSRRADRLGSVNIQIPVIRVRTVSGIGLSSAPLPEETGGRTCLDTSSQTRCWPAPQPDGALPRDRP